MQSRPDAHRALMRRPTIERVRSHRRNRSRVQSRLRHPVPIRPAGPGRHRSDARRGPRSAPARRHACGGPPRPVSAPFRPLKKQDFNSALMPPPRFANGSLTRFPGTLSVVSRMRCFHGRRNLYRLYGGDFRPSDRFRYILSKGLSCARSRTRRRRFRLSARLSGLGAAAPGRFLMSAPVHPERRHLSHGSIS